MSAIDLGMVIGLLVAVGAVSFVLGQGRAASGQTMPTTERRLEEYSFYPFVADAKGHVEFDPEAFTAAVRHLLDEPNVRAARELIVIGEQNLVRDTFPSDWLESYKQLYARYDGDAVMGENDVYLENYVRIVHQIGRSFPNTGIEILLHNLVNPSRSLIAIENGEVTGRQVGSGATNLVLDPVPGARKVLTHLAALELDLRRHGTMVLGKISTPLVVKIGQELATLPADNQNAPLQDLMGMFIRFPALSRNTFFCLVFSVFLAADTLSSARSTAALSDFS